MEFLGIFIKGIIFFLIFLILNVVTKGGVGAGDAKLALLIGLSMGIFPIDYLFVILVASFVMSALFSIALLVGGKVGLKSKVPFGPFLLLATWLCIAFIPDIANALQTTP